MDYSYLFTRSYAKWLGQESISIAGKDYKSINQTVDILKNPWLEKVQINGTDGD